MTLRDLVARQRVFFQSGLTLDPAWRIERLQQLGQMLEAAEDELLGALQADLGKSKLEAYTSELGFVATDIAYAVRHLSRWLRPRRYPVPLIAWPGHARVVRDPLGVALIIGPWNYPVQLLLSPLVAALAAGNCACLKPSELAPRTAAVLAAHMARCFAPEEIALVCGDSDTAAALLRERFDTIFFTGSGRVGRLVMRAAADHLTPVTLELGGKSPCLVCDDAAIETASRRIIWGKCLNAGQTCVAPDYVLVDYRVESRLRDALQAALLAFFPQGAAASPDYGRIVNAAHYDRLVAFLEQGVILAGGARNAVDRFIEPTLLGNVRPDAPVMQEEIFGPILPLLPVDGVDAALTFVRARPSPLALYAFTGSRDTRKKILQGTASGGVCFNDTITHIVGKALPFGGVGESGMGRYRGRAGFETFTNARAVMTRAIWPDAQVRYPPARLSLQAMKKAYRFLVGR